MKSFASTLLLLFGINNAAVFVVDAKDIIIENWAVQLDRTPAVPETNVNVGDTVTFKLFGPHTVYIHPTLTCDETDRIELSAPVKVQGDDGGREDARQSYRDPIGTDRIVTYTFKEEDSDYFGKTMFFTCDAGTHCENNLHATFRVFPAPSPITTLPPTQEDDLEFQSLNEGESPANTILPSFMVSVLSITVTGLALWM